MIPTTGNNQFGRVAGAAIWPEPGIGPLPGGAQPCPAGGAHPCWTVCCPPCQAACPACAAVCTGQRRDGRRPALLKDVGRGPGRSRPAERIDKGAHRRIAPVGVDLERLSDRGRHVGGDGWVDIQDKGEVDRAFGRVIAGQHLVEQHRQAVHVRAHVGLPGAVLLGRGIAGGAQPLGVVALARFEKAGNAKVDQLEVPIGLDHDIARLEIAKDDGRVLLMQISEHTAQLSAPTDHPGLGKAPPERCAPAPRPASPPGQTPSPGRENRSRKRNR